MLGQAIREALGDKSGISRYGDALVPLDEALAQAVVDICGRPYLVHSRRAGRLRATTSSAATSPARSCATCSRRSRSTPGSPCTSRVLAGRDPHHIAEAEYKAFARAFRQAKALDPLRGRASRSTKGAL